MTHKLCRCVKCKTTYSYQGSGPGCNSEVNNDRYCPSCMALIVTALKDVPQKFFPEYLPPIPGQKVPSIEEFDATIAKNKEHPYWIPLYPLILRKGIKAEDCTIGSTSCELITR